MVCNSKNVINRVFTHALRLAGTCRLTMTFLSEFCNNGQNTTNRQICYYRIMQLTYAHPPSKSVLTPCQAVLNPNFTLSS